MLQLRWCCDTEAGWQKIRSMQRWLVCAVGAKQTVNTCMYLIDALSFCLCPPVNDINCIAIPCVKMEWMVFLLPRLG